MNLIFLTIEYKETIGGNEIIIMSSNYEKIMTKI